VRIGAMICALLALAFVGPARAAAADDGTLNLVGGASAAGFFEVLEYVAQAAGYYREQHITVNSEFAGAAAACLQLVASGKGDVCASSIEPLIQGYGKGLRLQMFFDRDPQFDWVIGVLDSSPIKTLADFKGKDLGEMSAGSAGEAAAESMLGGAGLSRSDYAFVPIGGGAQGLAAIAQGRVAGAMFPTVELQMDEALGHVNFRFFRHPILKDVATSGFVASPATIATKADTLRRFCRAMVEAGIFIRVNPQVAARYFLQGAGLKVTPASLAGETRAIELSQADLLADDLANPRLGYVQPLGITVYSRFLVDRGLASAEVPADAIVTNQFVAYANAFDRKAFIARAKSVR
jgi:NitT/TauT family transport system substrate-binding protein